MGLLDYIFPGRAAAEAERFRQHAGKLAEMYERELSEMMRAGGKPVGDDHLHQMVAESSQQVLGNPWWTDMSSILPDEAWRRGYPDINQFYAYNLADEAKVAHNDALRRQTLITCRALYVTHPHARGVIKNAVAFVGGSTAWQVTPQPKRIERDQHAVEPVSENRYAHFPMTFQTREDGTDAGVVAPVGRNVSPLMGTEPFVPPEAPGFADEDVLLKDVINLGLQHTLKKALRKYQKRGTMHPTLGWAQFWLEALTRFYRDGEVFIHLGRNEKGNYLTPRFLDPQDISTPMGASGAVDDPRSTGVETDPKDEAKIVAFWWKPYDRPVIQNWLRIPADEVLFLKHGTDSTVKRGLPMLFTVRHYLRHFDNWLYQSIRAQRIQSSIALLRQWQNSDAATVQQTMLTAKKQIERTVTTPAGASVTYTTVDQMPVIDAPAGMQLTAFAPKGNFGDSEILVRRVLLGVCAGIGMSEAMVTADGSNANYSSSRITQFIPLRIFEQEQGLFGEVVEDFYRRWYRNEAAMKRLPRIQDDCELDCHVTPAALPNFEAEVVAQTAISLYASKIWDRRTAIESTRVDADVVEERLKQDEERTLASQVEQQEENQTAQQEPPNPAQVANTKAKARQPDAEDEDEEEAA